MANLILDIGNTRTKIAVFADGRITEQTFANSLHRDAIEPLFQKYDIRKAIASVVGEQPDFETILPKHIHGSFHLLTEQSVLPIEIDYATPHTLGMDRVAAASGAVSLCKNSPLLVIDAGSCITIDYVDEHAVFHGGAILPGINMKLRALHHFTSALPLVSIDKNKTNPTLTGHDTEQSILAGVLNATEFELQGFINAYEHKHPHIKVFLTGGDAVFFADKQIFPNFATPALVQIGLNNILELNT